MSRLYIAGGSAERGLVSSLMTAAIFAGHDITHDWTRCEGYDRESNEGERALWAQADLAGVRAADVVWVIAPEARSEGSACELGYALALGKRIVVSGPRARDAGRIFYLLTEVYDDHDAALRAIPGDAPRALGVAK